MLRILTPNGWSTFKGVTRKPSDNIVTLRFASGKTISATRDHRFFRNDVEVRVYDLCVGDLIDPSEIIVSIEDCEPQYVYDVVETDQHKFYANGIISHNCEFMGSSGTLISGAALKSLQEQHPIYSHENLHIFKDKIEGHQYVMLVDTSRGKGLDYCAFSIVDVSVVPYVQAAIFRSNVITPQDYTSIVHKTAQYFNDAHVLIELNDGMGMVVSEALFWNHEYENILMTESAGRAGKRISAGFGRSGNDRGIMTSRPVKAVGCSMLKLLVEQKKLTIYDKFTIDELKTFSKDKDSYKAEEGKHDDLVMGLVLFGWMTTQDYFKQITEIDVNDHLKELTDTDVEDFVKGMGIMVLSDGVNDYYTESDF